MNISSTSLFHFTSKIETLKSILENDFYAQFSIEKFLQVIIGDSDPELEKGIPMVCFCDIPLFQAASHTKIYGSYALGLTKEWAVKNRINPVIYSYNKSAISDSIKEFIMEILKDKTVQNNLNHYVSTIIQYIKPYEGPFKKGPKRFKNIRFYNEREWRYIPKIFEQIGPSWMKKSDGRDLNPSEINKDIIKYEIPEARLKFVAQDIKHIIVKTEKEIPKMIKALNSMKTNKYTIKEGQLLMTKITSFDQILHDY